MEEDIRIKNFLETTISCLKGNNDGYVKVYKYNLEILENILNELERLQKEKNTMLEDITKMNNYIKDLQKMVNWGDIVITECPECNKKFTINYCREVQNLKEKVNELQKENEHYKELMYALETYYSITEEDLEKCVKEDGKVGGE